MLPSKNIQSIVGATLYGSDKVKLGRITQVYVDATDGHPTWAEVKAGTVARWSTFVPLHEATWENDDVYVPYSKDLVKDAPRVDGDGGLNPQQESELARHYARDAGDEEPHIVPGDVRGRRDEEATEPAQIPEDTAEPAANPEEGEVLMEERLVVRKEKVPVARVRLEKRTVTEQREVAADVQKERIEVERDEPRQ